MQTAQSISTLVPSQLCCQHEGNETVLFEAPLDSNAGLSNLMQRYIAGDELAFNALHTRLRPALRRIIARKVSDRYAIEDLLQTTFLKAHLARTRFSVEYDDNQDRAVSTWYAAIARNTTTDYLRRTGRSKIGLANQEDESWLESRADLRPNMEEIRMEAEEKNRILSWLADAIARLPQAQREVIHLHRLAELSMAEVAKRQGAKVGTIRVRAHRAYAALAKFASEHFRM
jgi:RNA polymerase sigma-70 factor (ECF subfamily)